MGYHTIEVKPNAGIKIKVLVDYVRGKYHEIWLDWDQAKELMEILKDEMK